MNDPSVKRAKTIGADWSQLPDELLSAIANRFVVELRDFSVFVRVCTSWRFTLSNHPFTTFPWLLARNSTWTFSNTFRLQNICKRFPISQFYGDFRAQLPLELPLLARYWGSPTGWMFCQNFTANHEAKLINPVTLVSVALPPIDHKIRKGLVFERPNSSDGLHGKMIDRLQVVAINGSGQEIMVAVKERRRSGQYYYKEWITYNAYKDNDRKKFVDVVGSKDGFYALCSDNSVVFFAYDHDDNICAKNMINFKPPSKDIFGHCVSSLALVESEGELLMVAKTEAFRKLFEVLKLNLESGGWSIVEDLGNRCLFVGSSSYSTYLTIKDDDKGHRWRSNCVYVTQDEVGSYMNVCNIKEKEMQTHILYLDAGQRRNFGLVWLSLNCY